MKIQKSARFEVIGEGPYDPEDYPAVLPPMPFAVFSAACEAISQGIATDPHGMPVIRIEGNWLVIDWEVEI